MRERERERERERRRRRRENMAQHSRDTFQLSSDEQGKIRDGENNRRRIG